MAGWHRLVAIDNSARINESYGFEIGDQAMGAVGWRVRCPMRGKDTLGRYADNTFGLVLTDCTSDDMANAANACLRAGETNWCRPAPG